VIATHRPRGRIRRETLRAPPIPVTVIGETTDLAKAMQNPVASLISLPIQKIPILVSDFITARKT
jgi:hypothetical protein